VAVKSYFDALENQLWHEVVGLVTPAAYESMPKVERDAQLLPAAALQLRLRHYDPPTEVEIENVLIDAGRADVSITFGLPDTSKRFEGTMRLHRKEGLVANALVRWQIADPLATLNLADISMPASFDCKDSSGEHAWDFCLSLNGLPAMETTGTASPTPQVLPGRHWIDLHGPPSQLRVRTTSVIVPPGGVGTVDL
jgi:hypothetical protein